MMDPAPPFERMQDPVILHSLEIVELFEYFRVDSEQGLSQTEAARRTRARGPNELSGPDSRAPWTVLRPFASPWIWIPAAAAAICFAAQEWAAGIILFITGLANFLLSGLLADHPEDPLPALRRLVPPYARVRRDGRLQEIESAGLAPGDVISLEAGDTVPADARLFESVNLRVRESAITGETRTIEKVPQALSDRPLPAAARTNLVFMGTSVVHGRGRAVVIQTGMGTELGRIAEEIQAARPDPSPLQAGLPPIGRSLALAGAASGAAALAAGLVRGASVLDTLRVTASFLTALFPEGMLALAAACLASGAARLVRSHARVRRLSVVERLGAVTYILTGRTQTLTEPRSLVRLVDLAGNQREIEVQLDQGHPVIRAGEPRGSRSWPAHSLLLAAGALASRAMLEQDPEIPGQVSAVGDPVEAALAAAAVQVGFSKPRLDRLFPRLIHSPWSARRTRMSSLHDIRLTPHISLQEQSLLNIIETGSPYLVTCLGGIQSVLDASDRIWANGSIQPLDEPARDAASREERRLEAAGIQPLAVAIRPLKRMPALVEDYPLPLRGLPGHLRDLPSTPGDVPSSAEAGDELERELILVGLIGIADPPRPGVLEAVRACKDNGIHPAMACEDRPPAAGQIARSLGLSNGDAGGVITGSELARLQQSELNRAIEQGSVFSQISPAQRLDIVRELQRDGHVVAATGAGVDDAPVLRHSQVGAALQIGGTEVSEASAGVVLEDNSFPALVQAVEEGRRVSWSLWQAIRFTLTGSLTELLVLLFALLLGLPAVLVPVQILWLNLSRDLFAGLAGTSPAPRPEGQVQRERPSARFSGAALLPASLAAAVVTLIFTLWAWTSGHPGWRTMAFGLLAFQQAIRFLLDARSPKKGLNPRALAAGLGLILVQLAVLYWPPAQALLGTGSLPPADLLVALAAAGIAAAAWKLVEVRTVRQQS